jgi:hypothetical protein
MNKIILLSVLVLSGCSNFNALGQSNKCEDGSKIATEVLYKDVEKYDLNKVRDIKFPDKPDRIEYVDCSYFIKSHADYKYTDAALDARTYFAAIVSYKYGRWVVDKYGHFTPEKNK